MLESDPQKSFVPARAAAATQPQAAFAGVASVLFTLLALAGVAFYGPSAALALSLAVFTVMAVTAIYMLPVHHPFPRLGTANKITAARGAMAAFLAGAALTPALIAPAAWLIFGIAVIAFALDGCDGFYARREKLCSDFGARFDMEIDALLGAVLSLVLLQSGKVGPEILILGFMRYGFVAASVIWPWLAHPLPEKFRRKAVCVLQIGALIFLLCPLAPAALLMPLSLLASLALAWSFAIDVLWLKRANT